MASVVSVKVKCVDVAVSALQKPLYLYDVIFFDHKLPQGKSLSSTISLALEIVITNAEMVVWIWRV